MNRRAPFSALLLLVLAPPLVAAPPDTSPSTAPAPDLSPALQGLTADDFATREAALKKLQELILEQTRQQARIQEILQTLQQSLAAQVKQLAFVNDPEARARVSGLLEMQHGLTRWTIEVMKTPQPRRQTLLDWGLAKDNGPLLGKVYGRDKKQRLEAIKELAKRDGDNAAWTLAQLMNDPEAALRAQAMAASWERKPNDDILSTLWSRAVTSLADTSTDGVNEEIRANNSTFSVEFPGLVTPLTFSDEVDSSDDNPLAAALLIHYNVPETATRLRTLLARYLKENEPREIPQNPFWIKNVSALIEKYHVKEAVPFCAAQILKPANGGTSTGAVNGKAFAWSNRTIVLGALVSLTRQSPDDYKLTRITDLGDGNNSPLPLWTVPVELDEKAAVKKFHAWWTKSYKDYGVTEKPADLPKEPDEQLEKEGNAAPPPVPLIPPPGAGHEE